MKTKEELEALKKELDDVNKKLHELTEEELKQVTGGSDFNMDDFSVTESDKQYEQHFYDDPSSEVSRKKFLP